MRTLLVCLLLALPALALVPTAQAHHAIVCHTTDLPCMTRCLTGFALGHDCGIYALDPEVAECPAPYVGATVTADERTYNACILPPGVGIEPCPWPSQGYVIRVGDGEINTCFQ